MDITEVGRNSLMGNFIICTLPNIIGVNETRIIYHILIGKSDRKRTVLRPRLHKDCAS